MRDLAVLFLHLLATVARVVSKNPIDVEQRGVSDEVLDQLAVETLR